MRQSPTASVAFLLLHCVKSGRKERSRQRALLFYWKKEEWPHLREALRKWGRSDLISKKGLVPPGPTFGAWERKRGQGGVRYDTHMGMKVERASDHEQREENWEAIAGSCG